jgi:hypothetical protein
MARLILEEENRRMSGRMPGQGKSQPLKAGFDQYWRRSGVGCSALFGSFIIEVLWEALLQYLSNLSSIIPNVFQPRK